MDSRSVGDLAPMPRGMVHLRKESWAWKAHRTKSRPSGLGGWRSPIASYKGRKVHSGGLLGHGAATDCLSQASRLYLRMSIAVFTPGGDFCVLSPIICHYEKFHGVKSLIKRE